jgi:antitoxin VapB
MPLLEIAMHIERHVRLFKNGRNQAVRIPREMELPGDEALIYRDGQRLIIEPTQRPSLSRLLATWDPIDTDWPETEDRPPEPVAVGDP